VSTAAPPECSDPGSLRLEARPLLLLLLPAIQGASAKPWLLTREVNGVNAPCTHG
jgi:hypothetical protein